MNIVGIKEMGIDRSNFGRLIKKPEWKAFIADLGLNPQPLAGKTMWLRLVR